MTKELTTLNDELNELKRTLTEFTEEAEKRINDLLNKIDQSTEKTCDKELQDVVDDAKTLIEEPSFGLRDNILFDLFLSLINTYGLDRGTIEELYMHIDERDKNIFDYLEIFENDPTELNLINLLKNYCWAFDISFTDRLNSVFNYNNAMSIIFELKALGFDYSQFKMIKRSKRLSVEFIDFINDKINFIDFINDKYAYKFKENYYSDLLMITDVTHEQLDILKYKKEIDEILFPEGENNTYFIFV